MSQALILVDSGKDITSSSTTELMISALKRAINNSAEPPHTVQVLAANEFKYSGAVNQGLDSKQIPNLCTKDTIICPLTLDLPPELVFDAKAVFQSCRDVLGLRQRVLQKLRYSTNDGRFWLPVVLTAKGPLYGEVISLAREACEEEPLEGLSLTDLRYYQPFHLSDLRRQQLYQLGKHLLKLLLAPPATYLVQFGFTDSDVHFDRLYPFPSAPAIASLDVQQPDLFACHWSCLTNMPVFDLTIISPTSGQTYSLTLGT